MTDILFENLEKVAGVDAEAVDHGYPIPTAETKALAERVIQSAVAVSPRRYTVYPTQDGEIAVAGHGSAVRGSVLMSCLETVCTVHWNTPGRRNWTVYDGAKGESPDYGAVRNALLELDGAA